VAVAGYVRRHGFLLVVGSPVCLESELPRVATEFEDFARQRGCRVCYVCAEERLRSVFDGEPRHAIVAAGAQPAWDPRQWETMMSNRRSLRAQVRRAANKGVGVKEIAPRDAAADPEVAAVLRYWLKSRGLPPLHFMVEPDVLRGAIEDRIVLAARRGGHIVAYLVASPIPARRGYLLEEIARGPGAPNGVSELLIDTAMRRFAGEDRAYVSMGLVALARHSFDGNPVWLRALMRIARAHANRFYNFRGLEQFRAKLHPARWEKIWFITNEPRFSARALYAIGAAFSGISPVRAIAIGILKGAAKEIETLAKRGHRA
jgi:phosphatidylglycerol lysyltransferase